MVSTVGFTEINTSYNSEVWNRPQCISLQEPRGLRAFIHHYKRLQVFGSGTQASLPSKIEKVADAIVAHAMEYSDLDTLCSFFATCTHFRSLKPMIFRHHTQLFSKFFAHVRGDLDNLHPADDELLRSCMPALHSIGMHKRMNLTFSTYHLSTIDALLPHIRHLAFEANMNMKLSDFSILSHFRKLESLCIRFFQGFYGVNTGISAPQLHEIAASARNLEQLTLIGHSQAVEVECEFSKFRQLRKLILHPDRRYHPTDDKAHFLGELAKLALLDTLHVSSSRLEVGNAQIRGRVLSKTNFLALTELKLSIALRPDISLLSAFLHNLQSIQVLSIENENIQPLCNVLGLLNHMTSSNSTEHYKNAINTLNITGFNDICVRDNLLIDRNENLIIKRFNISPVRVNLIASFPLLERAVVDEQRWERPPVVTTK